MKKTNVILVSIALLAGSSSVFAQDSSSGTILAFDRNENVMVLTDRTVWSLQLLSSKKPEGLKAGDRVEILYESDEDGVSAITSIRLVGEAAAQAGADDVASGTVLAYDRNSATLILTDRTVWYLKGMKMAVPNGLKAGSRIEIDYDSDEDGIAEIKNIRLLSN